MTWHPMDTVPKDGTTVIVLLEGSMAGMRIHAARWLPVRNGILGLIGNVFDYDSPTPIAWTEAPEVPEVLPF